MSLEVMISALSEGTTVNQVLDPYMAAAVASWKLPIRLSVSADDIKWVFEFQGPNGPVETLELLIGVDSRSQRYFATLCGTGGILPHMVHAQAHDAIPAVGPCAYEGERAKILLESIESIVNPTNVGWPLNEDLYLSRKEG
jgi:hypothetical protein